MTLSHLLMKYCVVKRQLKLVIVIPLEVRLVKELVLLKQARIKRLCLLVMQLLVNLKFIILRKISERMKVNIG